MSISIGKIPGYAEAVYQEGIVRDAAFLSLNEDVAGFELRPMTLSDYLVFCISDNEAVFGGDPSDTELIAFLWMLSPGFSTDRRKRAKFTRRCRKIFGPPDRPMFCCGFTLRRWFKKWNNRQKARATVLEAIRKYVEETFQDRPSRGKNGSSKTYYSQAASICGQIMKHFFQRESDVMSMPLKRIFQYLKVHHALEGRSEYLFNPSDAVINRWAMSQQQKQ